MRHRYYALPLIVVATATGCTADVAPSESVGDTAEAVSSCPARSTTDDNERVAATLALELMRQAAALGGAQAPTYGNTILASQRYEVQSSGSGIDFNPKDPLYSHVTNQMKATLAFAQLDPAVATFLSDGLKYAYATSDGWWFPSINAMSVLANFKYPGATTVHLANPTSSNNSHTATATGQPWCGTSIVTIAESVQQSWEFSPLISQLITNPGGPVGGGWITKPPTAFHGTSVQPTTPFNGPSSLGNPYLVVSVGGAPVNWAKYPFTRVNCWPQPNYTCTGTIQIDPIPYAEPGQYYDANSNLIGTQSKPFNIVSTLYAVADHQSQWATRTTNSTQEWGTFSTPVTLFGVTQYKYVKRM